MRAFVTGASGFVGSAVVRLLLQTGHEVRALVRTGSVLRNLEGLDVELVYADLMDRVALKEGMRGCDLLFHVAAFYSTDPNDIKSMYEVNVEGTKRMMQAALEVGVTRAVHTSTIGTIGQPGGGRLAREDVPFDPWGPASHYAKSKHLGELVALEMGRQGLPIVVVHPCAPVGAGDIKPSSSGQRIVDYLNGKRPSYAPGGINWISVEDVAAGELSAAIRGIVGERYILGYREGNLTLEQFYSLMERVSGVPRPRTSRPRWSIRAMVRLLRRRAHPPVPAGVAPQRLTCDPSKAIRELGLPQTPLDEAFHQAVTWFRTNGYVKK